MNVMARQILDRGDDRYDASVADPRMGLSDEEILEKLGDWWWRMTSGVLYRIRVKDPGAGDDPDAAGLERPFIPNHAQIKFLKNLHNRNIILKARQLGFTTLMAILETDQALWNGDQNCVVIAHKEADAEEIFRDKIKYAIDRLPAPIKAIIGGYKKETGQQIVFNHNNSVVRTTVSARSGTPQVLHVSELGKIAANYPAKATEMASGSFQAVPLNGLLVIESTAEGQSGLFFELATRAEANWRAGKRLGPTDYRFHFFPWWEEPNYSLAPEDVAGVPISLDEHKYFDEVEGLMDTEITLAQRAWYVGKRDTEFAHEPELMWREYPSTPAECWQSSSTGKYYHRVIQTARAQKRIGHFPVVPGVPINGFWDLGVSDTQTLWLHQYYRGMNRFVGYHEETEGTGFLPFFRFIDQFEAPVGGMYLPHDASQRQQDVEVPTSTYSRLIDAKPSWSWFVVPRTSNVQHGIDLVKDRFALVQFDEEGPGIKTGLKHLENYSRNFNKAIQAWTSEPVHNEASHAADAFRQWAQGYDVGVDPIVKQNKRKGDRRRRSAMCA